jgi:formylglycine-generating enzyme required for sulfatase activity
LNIRSTATDLSPLRSGQDYALFFAVDDYSNHPDFDDLNNPVKDARAIARELEEMFAFETQVYENSTQSQIWETLRQWQLRSFGPDDQLFVFFSGHGDFDEFVKKGYFLTQGANERIDLTDLGNIVTQIPCEHILLAIDACYSGTIDQEIAFKSGNRWKRPNRSEESEKNRLIHNWLKNKSRLVVTSGGKERTPDGIDHSPFTDAFLKGLKAAYGSGDGLFSYPDLLGRLERVSPRPHQGQLRGHDEGGFVFISSGTATASDSEWPSTLSPADLADGTTTFIRPNEPWRSTTDQWIFDGLFADDYIIGGNTQLGQKDWFVQEGETFILNYPGRQEWGVVYISQGPAYDDDQQEKRAASDLTAFTSISFELKGANGGEHLSVGMKDKYDPNNGAETRIPLKATADWQSYTFQLADFKTADQRLIHIPLEFVFGEQAATVYIKNIRMRKEPATGADPIIIPDNFVRLAGGTFIMGCQNGRDTDCQEDETPHEMTIADFYISKYEVTQAEWRQLMGSDPPELHNKGCDQCPVESVSWDDIQAFLYQLNAQTAQNYRLPTEAEWEYAARGGNKSQRYIYSGSNTIDEVAWYDRNYNQGKTHGTQKNTHPVGSKKPNELGLYDMSGNVWEWCSSWYREDYRQNLPNKNLSDTTEGPYRVQRGGSWLNLPSYLRCTYRSNDSSWSRSNSVGFRLARSVN